MRAFASSCIAVILFFTTVAASGQVVGDSVQLSSRNVQGVPVHPAPGDDSYVRWNNGTKGKIVAIDAATGWFQVQAEVRAGWVTKSYITVIATDPDGGGIEPAGPELLEYVVGTWNLEWFKDGKPRGFPENTQGGPSYPSRSPSDYQQIAGVISTQIFAKILVLNEINGDTPTQSVELDRLVGYLGTTWAYALAASGEQQRTAIIYDTASVRKDSIVEMQIPEEKVNNKNIFDRDPLVGKFTLLDRTGQPKNDLLIVGVHLASGQQLVANHNRAMVVLRDRLHQLQANGTFPAGERDVLILGDFNANRYDTSYVENFWTGYDDAGFKFRTLAPEDQDDYFPTRLAGVPLAPISRIDYILGSAQTGGITDELVQLIALVHAELLPADVNLFRAHLSDHLPVTVRVRVVTDDD